MVPARAPPFIWQKSACPGSRSGRSKNAGGRTFAQRGYKLHKSPAGSLAGVRVFFS